MSTPQNPATDQSAGPPYEFIHCQLLNQKVIPFLGAGASLGLAASSSAWVSPQSNFLPKADELASYLEHRSRFPAGEVAELPRVAQYFYGVAGPEGLGDELHAIFSRRYEPIALHHYLAGFPTNLLIVTTNYDTLLECAFEQKGRPYDLVVYNTNNQTFCVRCHGQKELLEVGPDDIRFASPDMEAPEAAAPNGGGGVRLNLGETSVIYKMHGTAFPEDADRDSYVITEDDYVDFLARMTSKTAIPSSFAEPFRRSHFLFLGYGLRDWNLRVVLHKIWKEWPRRRACWAIQYKTSQLEREFWSKRMLNIYEMSIDDFLKNLPKA